METSISTDYKKPTKQEILEALSSSMFLLEKNYGRIKTIGCADGRKQKDKISKEDAASPTVALESIMINSAIEQHEERDVSTIDIPVTYLHTQND